MLVHMQGLVVSRKSRGLENAITANCARSNVQLHPIVCRRTSIAGEETFATELASQLPVGLGALRNFQGHRPALRPINLTFPSTEYSQVCAAKMYSRTATAMAARSALSVADLK
jgi:hypothetical protein